MTTREKTDKIVENIEKINRLIHKRHHDVAKRNNLSLDQFHLLVHLEHKWSKHQESPTIGDIAKRSRKAQNTISERVSRLEEKGLLKRVRDEKDRRISRVAMTEEGKELINSINYQASNEFVYNALLNMSHDTSDYLLNGLNQLVDKLQEEKGDFND